MEVTKQELLEALRANRSLQVFDSTNKLWEKAFKMYHQATGQNLDLGCGKCYERVKTWLEKE